MKPSRDVQPNAHALSTIPHFFTAFCDLFDWERFSHVFSTGVAAGTGISGHNKGSPVQVMFSSSTFHLHIHNKYLLRNADIPE